LPPYVQPLSTPTTTGQPALQPAAPKSRRALFGVIIGIAALAVIAAVVLVLIFVVLPSDTSKAKEYIKKGNSLMDKKNPEFDAWSKIGDEFFASSDESASGVKKVAADLRVQSEKLTTGMEEAKAEYKKVLTLKGVADYAKYARLKMDGIDLLSQVFSKTNDFMDKLSRVMSEAEAGISVDLSAFTQEGVKMTWS
jgi:flagellar basal body-associated protein FliL